MGRIEALKATGRWSFRQQARFVAPERSKSHWDHLLEEALWLQVDFRQEKRWKMACAYELARSAASFPRHSLRPTTENHIFVSYD